MLGTIVEDRYLVEAELGAGAMGHVYRARHIKVGRQVAIKVMHRELARVPSIVERFAREARIAARLDHPNLVSVLDVGVTPDSERLPLIVLELAPGVALTDITLSPLPREQVVSVVRQLLRGLDHAHDAGLIHRDLKPDNILVEQRDDGTLIPRIVDFGIAVYSRDDDPIAGRRLTEANTVIGTPFYMSPEQAMAKSLDARTDLFSLGVIMYELLAGMPPFPGSGLDVAYLNATKDAPTIVERAGIQVDPLLEAFVHKLMARRLCDRFQTAHQALAVMNLIETDRIAAARALSGNVAVATPVAVPALGSGPISASNVSNIALPANSDVLGTHPIATRAPVPLAVATVPAKRRSTRITQVEHIAGMRPARRRALWAGAIAAAALTAIVGWSAGIRPHADAPRVEASLGRGETTIEVKAAAAALTPPSQSQPSALRVEDAPPAPPVPPVAIDESPGLRVEDAPTAPRAAKAARKATKPSTFAAAPTPAIVAPPVTSAVTAAVSVPATPAVAAPASKATDSAQDVAARYVAVGRLLRGAPDALWARYRLIRINDALASEASRREALVALTEIERAVKR